MDVRRFTYAVAIEDPETGEIAEHQVVVRAGDRLNAEVDANRFKLPDVQKFPQNHAGLWLWRAMTRLELLPKGTDFYTFRDRLLVEFDQAKPEGEAVDPTQASSEPGSPSPATSETSGSGSTPS